MLLGALCVVYTVEVDVGSRIAMCKRLPEPAARFKACFVTVLGGPAYAAGRAADASMRGNTQCPCILVSDNVTVDRCTLRQGQLAKRCSRWMMNSEGVMVGLSCVEKIPRLRDAEAWPESANALSASTLRREKDSGFCGPHCCSKACLAGSMSLTFTAPHAPVRRTAQRIDTTAAAWARIRGRPCRRGGHQAWKRQGGRVSLIDRRK